MEGSTWAVGSQASGNPICSTIHELRFTDRTASHWLIKNEKRQSVMSINLAIKSALSVNQKYHMYKVSNQRR